MIFLSSKEAKILCIFDLRIFVKIHMLYYFHYIVLDRNNLHYPNIDILTPSYLTIFWYGMVCRRLPELMVPRLYFISFTLSVLLQAKPHSVIQGQFHPGKIINVHFLPKIISPKAFSKVTPPLPPTDPLFHKFSLDLRILN